MEPTCSKLEPTCSKLAPRCFKMEPRCPQDGAKMLQVGAKQSTCYPIMPKLLASHAKCRGRRCVAVGIFKYIRRPLLAGCWACFQLVFVPMLCPISFCPNQFFISFNFSRDTAHFVRPCSFFYPSASHFIDTLHANCSFFKFQSLLAWKTQSQAPCNRER